MRGKRAPKRKISPDPVYNDLKISKLINYTMQDGKKSVAETVVYEAIDDAGKTLKKDPLEVFNKALDNIKPKMEVRSRRVGGANYQIPMPVNASRQETLAMRWIIEVARSSRKNMKFAKTLSQELVNAYNKEGNAFRKKEDTHKMAEANKAFAHFGW